MIDTEGEGIFSHLAAALWCPPLPRRQSACLVRDLVLSRTEFVIVVAVLSHE